MFLAKRTVENIRKLLFNSVNLHYVKTSTKQWNAWMKLRTLSNKLTVT